MRLASLEGPQRIGAQKRYVVVPEDVWDKLNATARPLGSWLVENMPRAAKDAAELQLPDRRDAPRDNPFEPVTSPAPHGGGAKP